MGKVGEIAIRTDDHEGVDPAVVRQSHCLDRQQQIGRVLAGAGMDQPKTGCGIPLRYRSRIAVNPLDHQTAEGQRSPHDLVGPRLRDILAIDKDGDAALPLLHGLRPFDWLSDRPFRPDVRCVSDPFLYHLAAQSARFPKDCGQFRQHRGRSAPLSGQARSRASNCPPGPGLTSKRLIFLIRSLSLALP